jgi:hypothetical protein
MATVSFGMKQAHFLDLFICQFGASVPLAPRHGSRMCMRATLVATRAPFWMLARPVAVTPDQALGVYVRSIPALADHIMRIVG